MAALLLCPYSGCARQKDPDPSSITIASATSSPTSSPTPAAPTPPAGYQAMTVMDIAAAGPGSAVLLVDSAKERILPIFVGGTEALSIQLRLDRTRYQRPLTHDLLDSIVEKLGGDLVKVHVDELRGSIYIGTVFVRQGDRVIEVDARPSDAIALALGHGAPIFVAVKVLDAGGLRRGDLEEDASGEDRGQLRLPPAPSEPMAL